MTALLGRSALWLAFGLALYGALAAGIGARRRNRLLVESARTSAYSLLALVAAATGLMEAAILSDDFSLRYVAENSSRATPTFFKVLSLWGADEGSLLLWNLVLAGYIASVARAFRRRRPETFPWALAAMYGVAAFYLFLVVGPSAPFAELVPAPPDGRGPLPLLQNHPLMAAHPPALYLGFIGFTVPFAFGVAALVTGRVTDEWIRATRRWSLTAWVFLTLGLLLGGLWSYGVLGWGGYWAWDPVENASLLPWLTATAFLHSVLVEERRGALKVWNLSLVVGTFALTVFGTALTRGSILYSVHAFAESLVGPLYLGFLGLVLVGGFGLIAARSSLLAPETDLGRPLSREGAFLANNLLFTALTFTVLVGTVYPLLAEALTGRKVSVGGPYFRDTTVPVMILLLFLMGVGPLLPWRAASRGRVAARLRGPAWAGAFTAAALAGAGMRNAPALLAFALAAFAGAGTLSEMTRGVRAYRRAFGGGVARAASGAARRNRRLYGGLVVHLGVVLAAVAVTASSSFERRTEVTLARGETVRFAGHEIRFDGVRQLDQAHRRVEVGDLSLLERGSRVGGLSPSVNHYPASRDPIGTPAIRVGLTRDLYASIVALADGGREITLRLQESPGVLWLWVGGAVAVAGGLLAAWPAPRARPLPARTPPPPTPTPERVAS